jgi:hypothetical protein
LEDGGPDQPREEHGTLFEKQPQRKELSVPQELAHLPSERESLSSNLSAAMTHRHLHTLLYLYAQKSVDAERGFRQIAPCIYDEKTSQETRKVIFLS